VRWIEQERGLVPVEFERLLDAAELNADLRAAIDALLDRKRSGMEEDARPRLPTIHAFIEAELERQEDTHVPEPATRPGIEPLNTLFRDVLDRFPSCS
jgi:predicted nucleotidyltransferase